MNYVLTSSAVARLKQALRGPSRSTATAYSPAVIDTLATPPPFTTRWGYQAASQSYKWMVFLPSHSVVCDKSPVDITDEAGSIMPPANTNYYPSGWYMMSAPPLGTTSLVLHLSVYRDNSSPANYRARLHWDTYAPTIANYTAFATVRVAEIELPGTVPGSYRNTVHQITVGALCFDTAQNGGGSVSGSVDVITNVEYGEYYYGGTTDWRIRITKQPLSVVNGALTLGAATYTYIDTIAHDTVYPNS